MKRIGRIVVVAAIFGVIFAAIIMSGVKPVEVEGKIWTEGMVLGDVETATRHYIVYTDLMCPYCNFYENVITSDEEEFLKYLADNKIAYEVRVTDMLYESSGVKMSRPAAEAAYCAAREGKFFDFYHEFLERIFKDYYAKGIGNSKTASPISDMTRDYFKEIGEDAGLSEKFVSCYENEETLSEVQEKTIKASAVASGMPTFVFGKFTTGGFDPSWDWEVVKSMLDEGLK